VKNSKYMYK